MNINFDWEMTTFALRVLYCVYYIGQQMLLIKYIKIHIIKHNS